MEEINGGDNLFYFLLERLVRVYYGENVNNKSQNRLDQFVLTALPAGAESGGQWSIQVSFVAEAIDHCV